MNPYIGHISQMNGIEEHRLVGGKGDGMRLLEVNNGLGLELVVSPDRNNDITRLRFGGINLSYFSPCGYVSPAYYDKKDFLRSFTAGFLTTCGLEAVGTPCVDEGEQLELHGSIANKPVDEVSYKREEDKLVITSVSYDEVIFGRKWKLERILSVSLVENTFTLADTITNANDQKQPLEVLYHMNMGYPLLDEDSVITIPSVDVIPRDDHAKENIDTWMTMQKPEAGYQECCYYHKMKDSDTTVSIYQPKNDIQLSIHYDSSVLDGFVEWKMMGIRDYVLGLECGNCYPDGRDVMRKTGMLKELEPGDSVHYEVTIAVQKGESK